MPLNFVLTCVVICLSATLCVDPAAARTPARNTTPTAKNTAPARAPEILAEARLIDIYRLIGKGNTAAALAAADTLVNDHPTFALAQLVRGDLLLARTRGVGKFGDIPAAQLSGSEATLDELRSESLIRLKALRERPPAGTLPSEFLALSPRVKHAIAVDASRSRLYLFSNSAAGLTLLGDYYISVGKLGVDKVKEGDLRTPLGVYFITSQLDPKSLKDFYGAGALPINYPNVLDLQRGKTGSGIWLHGTPPGQFSRPPKASDGCVVLANPDLQHLLRTVAIRTTPVVISKQLRWVTPQASQPLRDQFQARLTAWAQTKSDGKLSALQTFYAPHFNNSGKTLTDWMPTLQREVKRAGGRAINIKDVSLLHWLDKEETMVVTLGELVQGQRTGLTKRQYWSRRAGQWTIFYEGVI